MKNYFKFKKKKKKVDKLFFEKYNLAENQMIFITDGSSHLRQLLIPECKRQNIELPFYYHFYFDIKIEFSKFYPNNSATDINGMMNGKF